MREISYMRQEKIFNPEDQKFKIKIVGVGSIGSWVTFLLTKLGINNITIYDYDKVEMHNIPNQFFKLEDQDKFKVEALAKTIKEFTDTEISYVVKEIDENTELNPTADDIWILALDSFEARKLIFDKLQNYPVKIVDGRMGGEEFSIYVIDCDDEKQCEEYQKSLELKPSKLQCGERSIVYTVASLASEIINIVKKIEKEEKYPTKIIRNMKQYFIINNQEEKCH